VNELAGTMAAPVREAAADDPASRAASPLDRAYRTR
jgi:hypothetical protein